MKPTARAQAARVIAEVLSGQSLSGLLDEALSVLADAERPLCQELVYGTLRDWPRLEALLRPLLVKPMRARDNDVLALIALGLYQLEQLRVPPHAAVSETVTSVKQLGKPWAKGLVNAVLRNAQRQGDALSSALTPAERGALPDWLFDMLCDQWPDAAERIVACARARPPMHLRVNRQQTDRDTVLKALSAASIDGSEHPFVDSAIMLDQPVDVARIPGFSAGWVSVQDAAAQLAAPLLGAVGDANGQPRLLDACAAPGGKACHIAERLGASTDLLATDVSEERLKKVAENRDRLRLSFAIRPMNAAEPDAPLASFDAILVDAPCSASGVLRRNPDIKLLRQKEDVLRFAQQQRGILQGLWPLLAPGGRLLYVTCSLFRQENDAVIDWALEALPAVGVLPLAHPMAVATHRGIQCLPSHSEGDGLYYSLLTKRSVGL